VSGLRIWRLLSLSVRLVLEAAIFLTIMGRFFVRTLAVVALGSFCVGGAAFAQSTPISGPGHVCPMPIVGSTGQGVATASASAQVIQPVGIRLLGYGFSSKDARFDVRNNTIFIAQGETDLAITVALNRTIAVHPRSANASSALQEDLSLTNVRTTLPTTVSPLAATAKNSQIGEVRFSIGADMPVVQPSESEMEFPTGEYDGSFSVTVNYN
jgi:hypothetical protein